MDLCAHTNLTGLQNCLMSDNSPYMLVIVIIGIIILILILIGFNAKAWKELMEDD